MITFSIPGDYFLLQKQYGFVEEGRFFGCTSLLGQEFVIKMYYAGKRALRGPL